MKLSEYGEVFHIELEPEDMRRMWRPLQEDISRMKEELDNRHVPFPNRVIKMPTGGSFLGMPIIVSLRYRDCPQAQPVKEA